MMRKPILRYSLLVLAFCATVTAPAMATTVFTTATGDMLAGSTLTVHFQSGVAGAPVGEGGIIVAGPGALEGSLTVPGFFHFTVTGDTYLSQWHLTNLKPDDFITLAHFFLSQSTPVRSLFDDGSDPSTPLSGGGRAGAVWAAGPTIAASGDSQPWTDVQNMGDMFTETWIQWFPNTFATGLTSSWMDDTDYIIPEPGTLCVLGIAGALAYIRRRRRA